MFVHTHHKISYYSYIVPVTCTYAMLLATLIMQPLPHLYINLNMAVCYHSTHRLQLQYNYISNHEAADRYLVYKFYQFSISKNHW